MNDREKMLALPRYVLVRAAGHARMMLMPDAVKDLLYYGGDAYIKADDLEALLTEPTLEEVLAELAEYGEPRISYNEDDSGWDCWMASSDCGACSTFADTPLQAARECLRRVKE